MVGCKGSNVAVTMQGNNAGCLLLQAWLAVRAAVWQLPCRETMQVACSFKHGNNRWLFATSQNENFLVASMTLAGTIRS